MESVYVSNAELARFCATVLRSYGVPDAHAELVAHSLVAANLRGVDSHGAQMLLAYIQQLEAASIDHEATGAIISEFGSCLVYDGKNGMGQVVADHCITESIRVARQTGIAFVVAKNSNHFGAAAFWAQQLADAHYIGIVMTNASPSVAPWQGKAARLGTNPICMAVPSRDSRTWLLDMATTSVALGKIYDAAYRGQTSIPEGWALDRDGNLTTNTDVALQGFPMPLGGYKGSGLGLMVELLTAALSGGPVSIEVGSLRQRGTPLRVSHLFLAIDPDRFIGLEQFKSTVSKLMVFIKSAPPASGYDEVLVAGEPEWRVEEQRLKNGIPVPSRLWEEFASLANKQNVRMMFASTAE